MCVLTSLFVRSCAEMLSLNAANRALSGVFLAAVLVLMLSVFVEIAYPQSSTGVHFSSSGVDSASGTNATNGTARRASPRSSKRNPYLVVCCEMMMMMIV